MQCLFRENKIYEQSSNNHTFTYILGWSTSVSTIKKKWNQRANYFYLHLLENGRQKAHKMFRFKVGNLDLEIFAMATSYSSLLCS